MDTLKIVDLGEIDEDIAVFGGAYSNLEATVAFLSETARAGFSANSRIFTGDAVAYCADPCGVIDALDGHCHWLAGNCETQLAAGQEDCGCGFQSGSICDRLSVEWYGYAQNQLTSPHLSRLAACPDIFRLTQYGRRIAVIHGGIHNNAQYIWPTDTEEVFRAALDDVRELVGAVDIVLAGHTGVGFQRQIDNVLWVNAGVIGMPPNDGRPMSRYGVLAKDGFRFHRLDFDHKLASAKIIQAGLSRDYADALLSGFWPSEDILPPDMRRL